MVLLRYHVWATLITDELQLSHGPMTIAGNPTSLLCEFTDHQRPWQRVCKLTHLPLDKMAAILADDIFKCIFLNENDKIPTPVSLNFVPDETYDNNPTLVQVMAWRRAGDKPSPDPMFIQFTGAYLRHCGRWVKCLPTSFHKKCRSLLEKFYTSHEIIPGNKNAG